MDALQYQEPSTTTLLILSSFLLALHIAAWPLDRLISCGLIGQILVGAIWGTPITSWLEIDVQDAVVQLGFIGLILLVYEGIRMRHENRL
jgi:Kef-type K+ transport system membrane component KefB